MLEFLEDRCGLTEEPFAVLLGNGLGVRQVHRTRIAMHAVEAILVMQVIGSREPRRTDIADRLPLDFAPRKMTLPSPDALMGVPRGAA